MNIKQLGVSVALAAGMFVGVAGSAFAAPPTIAQTWVSGTVFDSSHNPVNAGTVNVTCNGHFQSTSIAGDGTYGVIYQQADCKVGDSVSASASTSEGSGSNSDVVQNSTVNGPIVDLDIAVLDINVPEFGIIGGAITAIGAAGGYLLTLRRKVGV